MKTRFVTILLFALLVLLSGRNLFAGDAGVESPFGFGVGARSMGMGGGFTAVASGAGSVYFNPAGLAYMQYQEFSAMHTLLPEESNYSVASWVFPTTSRSGIGIGFARIGTDDIIRRVNYVDKGTFGYSSSEMLLSFGQNYFRPIALGVSVKVSNQKLDDLSEYGIGMDFGLRAKLLSNLHLGLIARDLIQADFQLDSLSEKTPRSFVAGLAYEGLRLSEGVSSTIAFDLEKGEHRNLKIRGGAELLINNTLALRSGYDRDNFSVGAGFYKGRIRIDYAYKLVDYISNLQHLSLSIFLGESILEREEKFRLAESVPPPLSPTELEIERLSSLANYYFHHFDLDSALFYFGKVLELDSTSIETRSTIQAIENSQRLEKELQGELAVAQEEAKRYLRTFYVRAELFFNKRNYSASLDYLDLILDVEPQNQNALALKRLVINGREDEIQARMDSALVFQEEGHAIKAMEQYSRVLELDPKNALVLESRTNLSNRLDIPQQLDLGIRLYERGKVPQARLRFQRVLTIEPNQPVALEYLGKMRKAPKVKTVRKTTLEDLQQNGPVWRWYTDGLRFMRDAKYEEAIASWNKVLEVFPESQNTLDNIEQAELHLQDKQE